MILQRTFYQQNPLTVAQALLGKILVHETPEGTVSGRIVETEAYLGPEDKASHAYGGKRTARTETQFGPKGHAYIYLIYGMYYCFNTTAGQVAGKPEAIFFRAIEPLDGIELMKKRRPTANGKVAALANGPSRLCMAMGINKTHNGTDLTTKPFYIKDDGTTVPADQIASAPRIGVDYADDWKHQPWRFYIKNNHYVSVRDKKESN
jgi:DNA-3-methyladenine glycosylase